MNFLHHSFKTTTGEAESELDTYSPFQKSSTDTTRFVRVVNVLRCVPIYHRNPFTRSSLEDAFFRKLEMHGKVKVKQ